MFNNRKNANIFQFNQLVSTNYVSISYIMKIFYKLNFLNCQFSLIFINWCKYDISIKTLLNISFYSSRFKKTDLVVNLICTLSGALLIMNSGHLYKYIAGHNLTSHPTKKQQLLLFIFKIWLSNFCHLATFILKRSTYNLTRNLHIRIIFLFVTSHVCYVCRSEVVSLCFFQFNEIKQWKERENKKDGEWLIGPKSGREEYQHTSFYIVASTCN